MEDNRRFTILTFPQKFDGNILHLNILFLPRNQNPLSSAIALHPVIPDAPAFADSQLAFTARITSGLDNFPMNVNLTTSEPFVVTNPVPANKNSLFTALANNFSITNLGQINSNANINYSEKAPDPVKKEDISKTVSKYLPESYRSSFNFIAPRIKNARTDDSYHCAVRNVTKDPAFKMSPETISWGKVFAYVLRQPKLAEELGIIYKTTLEVDPLWFVNGGWIYADLANTSDYFTQLNISEQGVNNNTINQETEGFFIKKYAARIPALEMGLERSLFAPVLFPVLFRKTTDVTDPVPDGNFDQVFIEASEYDDGFSKIVHAFQPVSQNLLLEKSDGFHPTKDVGIRLGWDDEQILIWYIRQMVEDETSSLKKRLDAPIGVFGYNIDVRKKGSVDWNSLNRVKNKIPLMIGNNTLPDFNGELPYQVYPTELQKGQGYWLPMYYANWQGKSMVLPDEAAILIFQNDKSAADSIPKDPNNDAGTGVTGPAKMNLVKTYEALDLNTDLTYGNIYEFRIRMMDLTGGGPDKLAKAEFEGPSPIAACHFKRYVAPDTIRILNAPFSFNEEVFTESSLKIKRPLLGYPSVVYTGKYADPVADLIAASLKSTDVNTTVKEAFGIADPDVETVEIIVEVQALLMDNLFSVSGKESYIKLYKTTKKFPAAFDDELEIPIEFKDCNVLNFGNPADLGDLGKTEAEIALMDELLLPTARNIRLTLRAVCEDKINYYGLENSDPDFNTRFGRIRYIKLYEPSTVETDLFSNTSPASMIKGIYLQPDLPPQTVNLGFVDLLVGKQIDKIPDMIQRLAVTLDLENTGLTLVGKKGERIQFGCSSRIRHTLAPDNSSITFASKSDLMNHWLCCITLDLDRDWTWDALEDRSFVITRNKKFSKQTTAEVLEVGEIELKKTISIDALHDPQRNHTRLIFIDAVEPKNDPDFPDMPEVQYRIETKFKTDHAFQNDGDLVLPLLRLPVTVNPKQLPEISSAGLALSPYTRNEKYSTTEPRSRFLWIEFKEPVKDPNDLYFCRVLGYAPDQLISNNDPELFTPPVEPALPIDPELIRIVSPNQPDDDAGINAMQPMEKALDSDKHYLMPLPPGLHSESDDLFGMFTYEFRVGHGSEIWSTAQGRFGRALRATGVQHPAPTLTCIVNRDEEKLYVSAPYAVTVNNGKNVTSDPPRTELWCLLYAQVRQADNKDFRNLLLDDKRLDYRVRIEHNKNVSWLEKYDTQQIKELKYLTINNYKAEFSSGAVSNIFNVFKLTELMFVNKDATKYGTVLWTSSEISSILNLYGLPLDSSLSVLCVEILPHITNIYEHINSMNKANVKTNLTSVVSESVLPNEEEINMRSGSSFNISDFRPLSDHLGDFRILRTSPLTEVPYVCCAVCD